MSLSVEAIREQFPLLARQVNERPLVYLDSAATTQKPEAVLQALDHYYRQLNSNVHRGAHQVSDEATTAFESAREKVARFLNASREEIIWTRGTTESINLVASSFGRDRLCPGDEVLITEMEHHSNIVPWQLACQAVGAKLKVVPVLDDGSLDQDAFREKLSERTRIFAVTQVSNSLGTVNPVAGMITAAREAGAATLVDGAQAVSHFPVDVQELDCDFYAFSGHKVFGPTGIGVLYGRRELLDAMPAYQGGGEMIETVTFEHSTWNELPYKFEAGTPNIAGAIGLGTAIEWLQAQDRDALARHEAGLLEQATGRARDIPGLKIIGDAPNRIAVLSFVLEGAHPNDVGMLLDQQGVAVRTGHHCTMPLMSRFGVSGTVRASLSMYNNAEDIERFFAALDKAASFL